MDEKNVVITYETLFELLRREKNRGELQELDPVFYTNVINYLVQKKQLIHKEPDSSNLFGAEERLKTEKQLMNIQRLVRELYERRERKIVEMALNQSRIPGVGLDESPLLPEEKTFYEEVKALFDTYRSDILKKVLESKEERKVETKESKDPSLIKVRFTDHIDQFAGPDMELYGPYEKEAVDFFNERIVNLLKARGCIEVLSKKS